VIGVSINLNKMPEKYNTMAPVFWINDNTAQGIVGHVSAVSCRFDYCPTEYFFLWFIWFNFVGVYFATLPVSYLVFLGQRCSVCPRQRHNGLAPGGSTVSRVLGQLCYFITDHFK